MRLINTKTLQLEQFVGKTPRYAILSHTWGSEEVTFQDFQCLTTRKSRAGFAKIAASCLQAQRHGLDYAWVDTCCIDKTSSAELGEAINSMFRWYRDSSICFAYLDDIRKVKAGMDARAWARKSFSRSRWFTRGWTLQELIAPRNVSFYDESWSKVGEKSQMTSELESITGIDESVLQGGPVEDVSIGRRMSWAADRQTARVEDIAYSLLGIFNLSMPLIYGEGERAFLRLQEEILRRTDDHTLFAWRSSRSSALDEPARGLLAKSPSEFRNFLSRSTDTSRNSRLPPADKLVRVWDSHTKQNPIVITNKGIQITGRVQDLEPWMPMESVIMILNCTFGGEPTMCAGIYLQHEDGDRYTRVRPSELANVPLSGDETRIYGIRSTADVKGHRYTRPWATLRDVDAQMRTEKRWPPPQTRSSHDYNHAFYIPKSLFQIKTVFGGYSLCGLIISDSPGRLRCFRPEISDLVLKTHDGFRAALMLRSQFGNSRLIILVGTYNVGSGSGPHFWFEPIGLSKDALGRSHTILSDLIARTNRLGISMSDVAEQKTALSSDGLWEMKAKMIPTWIGDAPMMRIEVEGPVPSSPYFDRPWDKLTPLMPYASISLPLSVMSWSLILSFFGVVLFGSGRSEDPNAGSSNGDEYGEGYGDQVLRVVFAV